jgi:glycogen(starch) synthase
MRVLHLTTEFPPVIYGGLGTAIGGLAHASVRAGIEVGILLVGSHLRGYGELAADEGDPGTVCAVRARPGLSVLPVPWSEAHRAALELCRSWRPDVLHLHVFWLWELAQHLQQQTGLPLVYTVHSLDVAEYELGNGPRSCLDQWQLQQAVLAHADVVHAPSQSEAELVVRHCPLLAGRVVVAGHGIESLGKPRAKPRMSNGSEEVTVLFVGRFVDRKGVRELLGAIPNVLDRAPRTRFVLSGGQRGVTASEAESNWLSPNLVPHRSRIRFTGWLPPEEIAGWYERADILVVPSWYEPFGMVVLEGMRAGMAIAASKVGGPAEIIEDGRTGLLFPPRDQEALSDAIVRLTTKPSLRRRLGVAAADEVDQRWLWPAAVERLRAVYVAAVSEVQSRRCE